MMVIGVDTHKSSHAMAAVAAETGLLASEREITASDDGHRAVEALPRATAHIRHSHGRQRRASTDRPAPTAVAFLRRAQAFYRRHGIEIEQLLTDNGSAYVSIAHAVACRALGIRHIRTRPYRPQTNGKAEHFIRTMLAGWAYGAIYRNSKERTAALDGWLWHYNHQRRHSALSHKPPIARLTERTNLPGTYT